MKFTLRHKIYLFVLVLAAGILIFALIKGPPRFQVKEESFTLIYTGGIRGCLLEPGRAETLEDITPADFTTLYMNLAEMKTEAGNRQEPVVFLDTGDTLAGDEDISRLMGGIPIDRLMYEVPYDAMLFRENEYLLGMKTLDGLRKKIPYLGMNARDASGKEIPFIKAGDTIKAGDLSIAIFGYFEPSGSRGIAGDFQFKDEFSSIQNVMESSKADIRILMVSPVVIGRISEKIPAADIIIPSGFHPSLKFRDMATVGENLIAPPVDSRFQVGMIRFVREVTQKGQKGTWQAAASVRRIRFTDEVPPGGILNVALDARQNIDIKYRGKYGAIYENLAFWAPGNIEPKKIPRVLGKSLACKYNVDGAIIDIDNIKLPQTQAWGSKDILDLPGKTLSLSIIRADGDLVEKILKSRPGLFLVRNEKKNGAGEGKEAEWIVVDRDAVKDFTLGDLKGMQECPLPGNFALLDYFRENRGKVFTELSDREPGFRDALELMDQWKFKEAARLLREKKGRKPELDALVYEGLCLFKSEDFENALSAWNGAKKLSPENEGILRILNTAPSKIKKSKKTSGGPTWHKFRGDARNTGRSAVEGPSSRLLKWKFAALDKVSSSPAVGPDGTIYAGAEDFFLYALKPNGELKWKYRAELPIRSSPAAGKDGTIYFGSDDKHLYALSPDGKLKWKFQGEGYFVSSPTLGEDGTIYCGNDDFNIYALSPDGKLKWKFPTGGVVFSSPALAGDGTVYIGSEDHFLYAISPDGKLKWKFEAKHKVSASPAVGRDGTIYAGSEDRFFYAINPDGSLKWKTELENYIVSSAAISSDGTMYVGSEDKNVYAISSEGKIKWKYQTAGEVISSPLVDSAGNIYAGSDGGNLYSLSPDGKERWIFMARDPVMSSPALGPDGTLYFGSEDRNIYAVGE